MEIAIFENEFRAIKTSFDGFNLLYFDNKLEYKVFPSSQDFGDLKNLSDYAYVIIDIDLSIKSTLDGFQLLEEMKRLELDSMKIMILTGHIAIKDRLKALNLPDYPIIPKPISLTKIKDAFDFYGLSL
ncbi:Response regulator receiver domain-containing protein [Pedobacter steynii]|uniref:Response regulator receiver domain-containing protein n=1 Tax=Pedobacter steynii TaxID=430522 RepID=A0A1G9JF46_9SPHI|nr:response regulator [Pedobacter steynii]NQX38225.1 response regulator [Pedobacter steynii]SDL35922.1 Response regulator receiver domain-containing protein [Pedobacter steynii]